MAKKKPEQTTDEQTKDEKKKGGQGKRACPTCGEIVGTRTQECPKCHHKFKKAKATAGTTDPLTWVQDIQTKVAALGGLEQLRKHIEAAEEAEKQLDALGGLQNAKKVQEVLEAVKKI